jgi:hypothetical protein
MTRNTIYVIRVGTQTPQGDGYTYLCWCDGEDYRWADHKDALHLKGRKEAEAAALAILRAMRARGYSPPVRVVPPLVEHPRASTPRRSWGKSSKRACLLSPLTL